MTPKELLHAAIDGAIPQVRSLNATLPSTWVSLSLNDMYNHYRIYPNGRPAWEYRIKPDPIPDKVFYGVIHNHASSLDPIDSLSKLERDFSVSIPRGAYKVKITIKTDDNGVETETVELVD